MKNMNKKKIIPSFKNEDEESEFWQNNDSTDFIDWGKGEEASFPNLKPSTQAISIRLPVWMIDELKIKANENDIGYQSLIKYIIAEKLESYKP